MIRLFCIAPVIIMFQSLSPANADEIDTLSLIDSVPVSDLPDTTVSDTVEIDTLPVSDLVPVSNLPVRSPLDTIEITRKKADFILEIASQIVFPEADSNPSYKIGIHGKSREIRALYDTLSKISMNKFLQGKPIEVLYFRNTRAITPIDLLYVNGESKIRIRDLNKKLEGHKYFIVTENFPFGTSLLNFMVDEDQEMQFEIQDEALIEQGAVITQDLLESPKRVRMEEKWGKIIENTQKQLEVVKIRSDKQEAIIEDQIVEIVQQEKLIFNQQIVILSTIVFITILTILVLIIIRLSKQRKEALLIVKQKNKDITDSIRYARYIQEAMLPPSERIFNAFSDSFVLYLPKDIISGDFYWFKDLGSIKMLGVADCTGHGVPGAFLSIIGNELLSLFAESLGKMNPGELLELIDRRIAQSLNQESSQRADGMDIALIFYNQENGMIDYAGAYRPLVMIRDNELTVLKATRSSVGGVSQKQTKRFPNTKFKTLPDDCFYMYSDGYPDQFGGQKKKKFMSRRLNNLLHEIHQLPMKQQKEKLRHTFLEWKGAEEQVDDVSVVGIRI